MVELIIKEVITNRCLIRLSPGQSVAVLTIKVDLLTTLLAWEIERGIYTTVT